MTNHKRRFRLDLRRSNAAGCGSGDHGRRAIAGDDGPPMTQVNARPMGPQKSPASEDPWHFIPNPPRFRKAWRSSSGRLSVVYHMTPMTSMSPYRARCRQSPTGRLRRARWQPAWNQFFPAGADDETAPSSFSASRPQSSLWVRGVTPAPSGRAAPMSVVSRPWRLVQADDLCRRSDNHIKSSPAIQTLPIDLLPAMIVP